MPKKEKLINVSDPKDLLLTLKLRFENNPNRHKDLKWIEIEKKINSSPNKFKILESMEMSGGEPDVVRYDKKSGEYIFFDCSPETPKERRSLCYDKKALDSRKEHKPKDSAQEMAKKIGITILTEEEYRFLQTLGRFDEKTSSWIETPKEIRDLGGALFCDRRYGQVFVYHNGAESYYAVRGFRGSLRV